MPGQPEQIKQLSKLQAAIDSLLGAKRGIKVLDAGCGSARCINIPQGSYVVGIDLSAEQLGKNSIVNEKIVGDIQRYDFAADAFDIILCWYVLEHLPCPEAALGRFKKSLKEGGLLILAVPNVLSIKGLVTKFTPLWFHAFMNKRIYGNGQKPFRTFLRFSLRPKAIREFALRNNLLIEYFSVYEGQLENKGINLMLSALKGLVRALSLGSVKANNSEYVAVLKKQGSPIKVK